jgi:hypothetical protein
MAAPEDLVPGAHLPPQTALPSHAAARSRQWQSIFLWMAVLILLIVVVASVRRSVYPERGIQPSSANLALTNSPAASAATIVAMTPMSSTPAGSSNPGIQRRPFAVVKETATHQWTAENGRDTNVIRRLAHNDLEYQRMVEETARIYRRQLVYRKEPISVTIERARTAGEPVHSFTLPGLDGQEHSVEVTQDYVERALMAGGLAGHLKDRPNSMVSIGFKDGYESFNIISPDDGIYITADARAPGEVVVKEFDPEKYARPPQTDEPDFILTK